MVHEHGPAETLHVVAADALNDGPAARTVRFPVVDRPALVLGSHQRADLFNPDSLRAAGVEVARRRSGGSAVLVAPGRVLWVDLMLPWRDPLWDDDVGRAAWWVGELWASALGAGEVWRGPMRSGAWSSVVCFAGVGPGEVLIDGRKVVGVCQRRTRRGALFQTAALLDWRPEEYTALVAGSVGDPDELAAAAAGIGPEREAEVRSALLARLMP